MLRPHSWCFSVKHCKAGIISETKTNNTWHAGCFLSFDSRCLQSYWYSTFTLTTENEFVYVYAIDTISVFNIYPYLRVALQARQFLWQHPWLDHCSSKCRKQTAMLWLLRTPTVPLIVSFASWLWKKEQHFLRWIIQEFVDQQSPVFLTPSLKKLVSSFIIWLHNVVFMS